MPLLPPPQVSASSEGGALWALSRKDFTKARKATNEVPAEQLLGLIVSMDLLAPLLRRRKAKVGISKGCTTIRILAALMKLPRKHNSTVQALIS